MLVVHLHAQRPVGLLAHLGNRVERGLLELPLRHNCHPRHQGGGLGIALVALELHRLVVPVHHIADAGKAKLLQLKDYFLGRHLSPLGPHRHELGDPSANHSI